MIHFGNDYHRSAHPAVLEAITGATGVYPGYGLDLLSEQARVRIRGAMELPEAGVHFMVGGTQANTTVISATLRPWQGVISADTGHINVHETGSVEHAGHKILQVPNELGKMTADQVRQVVRNHRDSGVLEHAVEPAMVYVSQPTEYGTMYSVAELEALRAVCDAHDLILFVDGARLGYGLATGIVTLPQLARLADVFTIGGTKCGALFGEAVVFTKPNSHQCGDRFFRNSMKQNSGLLAKGWLLGAQFDALFTDGLYERITGHANKQAHRIAQAFRDAGIPLLFDSPTNQQFVLLSAAQEQTLSQKYISQFFKEHAGMRAVRFATSWATSDEDVDALVADIARLT